MKDQKAYCKLVRDRIPEIIEQSGKNCTLRTLNEEEYLLHLDKKLAEELHEYQESKSLEEICDLVEVLRAVLSARGYTWEEMEHIRMQKHQERGGFEKRILLETVTNREET
ncbi:MAG: nucleoside triphosphate pyrophosphohydrolase [Clostridia bacterium]|nr:nucleoside triphosphate pyrophosphohydrolase [Clostridia bacterium]